MKKILVCAFTIAALGVASCSNDAKPVSTTNNADTAVLVNDQENTLNATPINDTMVADTVHVQQ